MTISRKEFEKANFPNRSYSRKNHPIYRHLVRNSKTAYTVKELSDQINKKESTIRSMLAYLMKEKLVLHRQPYFIVNESKERKNAKK